MPDKQACHKTLMAAPLYKVVPLFHIDEEANISWILPFASCHNAYRAIG
jgi:hypothetical protein